MASSKSLQPKQDYGEMMCQEMQTYGLEGFSNCDCSVGDSSVECGLDCPQGGSVAFGLYYSQSQSLEGTTYEYITDNCGIEGDVYDGYIYIYFFDNGEWAIIAEGTVNGEPFSYNAYYDGTYEWYIVEVNGDYYLVRGYYYSESSFDLYIKDSSGEWHCYGDSTGGFCDGPNGKQVSW